MKPNILLLWITLAFACCAIPAHAIIIGVEQFDYPDGAIAGQSGGTFWNWRNRTPAARTAGTSDWDNVENAPSIASGRLVMGGSGQNAVIREYNGPGEGASVDIDRDDGLGAINNFVGGISFQEKKVYYRVTVRTGATLPDYFGLSSHDFSTEKLFFGKRGGSSTFGLESVGGSGTNGTRTIDPNTTYTLVVRIDYVAGTIALFVDPSLNVDETSQLSISRTFDTSFWSTAVRLAAGGGGDPVQWDDLVVATTWEDLGTVVTTTEDHDDGSLDPLAGSAEGISLREAVKYSPTGSLITFDSESSGQTITLTHPDGDMAINRALTIDATTLPGGITLNGNNTHRHFFVNSGISLTLRGLTLTGGNGAGPGSNNGSGGAINNNSGTLRLAQCTFHGNSANFGGAILNLVGSITLTRCTFSANFANFAGAIANASTGELTLDQCTLSGNSAANKGGAISNGGALTLTNSIVAGNTLTGPDSSADISNLGTVTRFGANLVQSLVNESGGSDSGPAAITAAPKLSPLGYFGGPVQTMHPLICSPAIDAAGSTDPGGTDARGFPRFEDGDAASSGKQLDIGAVEAGIVLLVNQATDSSGSGTLRTRLANAAILGEPSFRIVFDPAVFPASTITLNGNHLTPPAGIAIFIDASNLSAPVTISGGGNSRVFNIPATATVAMHSLRIVNGRDITDFGGGGIFNNGTCSVLFSTLSGNAASNGGGIYSSGTCSVLCSTLSGNFADEGGGGILNFGTCVTVSSTFSGNYAGDGGGGISNRGTCTVVSSTISANSSGTEAAGIFNFGSTVLRLTSSIVAGNTGGNITGTLATNTNNLTSGDPLLAPLGDYGGRKETMRLLPGSPARDAGAASARTTDQRGFPIVGTADIGAYEAQIGPIADVTMVENTAPPTRNFSVGQIGTLTVASSNTALVPLANIVISGTGASRSISATPAATQLGSSIITLTDSLTGETQTYTVTVTLDPAFVVTNTNANGPGSLTQALINAANAAGPNTITFASGFANIMFPTGEFFITDNDPVAIDATSVVNGLSLSAPAGSRHFQVPVGKSLTLRGLTLENGDAGGDGGSIYSEGSVILERCTLENNFSAFSGGAVALNGVASSLQALNCTFHENAAIRQGGAIRSLSGTVSLTQCTVVQNTAPDVGGIALFNSSGVLNLTHCTVTGNNGGNSVGGVSTGATNEVTLINNIIAGNTNTSGSSVDIDNSSSVFTLGGANLIGSNEGVESIFPAGPLVGTAAAPLNPDLSPLGDYGGPTATIPPNVNSPAIDQASTLSPALTTDQRGEPRPLGVRPDLGAVESSVIIVTTPVDELDPVGVIGNGISLREAVRDIPTDGTIGFDRAVFASPPTLTKRSITLTKGPLNPQRECTLNGSINPGGITVIYEPEIIQQPQHASVAAGDAVSFSTTVTALSGGLASEWFKNGVGTGITTPVLNIPSAQEADEGVYFQQITEAAAATIYTQDVILGFFLTTSQPASLTVDGALVSILRSPSGYTIDLGRSHTLSVIAVGPAPLTYQWFKAGRAIARATKSSYVIPKAALSHAGAYTCVVKSGNTSPGVTSTTAEISVVDTREKRVSLKAGSKFTATVIAAGNGLSYQWNRVGSVDTTKTLTINSVSVADAGLVYCDVNAPSVHLLQGGIVQLFVSNAAPALVTPLNLPPAYIGQNYFYQLPVVNTAGAPAVSFSVSGTLPSGITFNKTTGVLSGRATVTKSAGYALSFKAINASGTSLPATATLTVNVVPPTAIGTFAGPMARSSFNAGFGGRFDLTTTAAGTFTGSITFGSVKRSFKSQLLLSAGAGDAILRGNIPGIKLANNTLLTAYIEVFAVEQLARLTLIDPTGTTELHTAWRKAPTATLANYTLRLDPGLVTGAPHGYGFTTLKATAKNSVTISGKLPDNATLTGSTFIGANGQVLIFQMLYKNKGSLVGQYQLTGSDISGALTWNKLLTTGTIYKDPFGPLAVVADGGIYLPPGPGQLAMPASSKLTFSNFGLSSSSFDQLVTISNPKATGLTNTAVPTPPVALSTKITKFDVKTGIMTGTFQEDTRLATWSAQLVKIGSNTKGYGYSLMDDGPPPAQKLSGKVVLGPP
ncbi:MAG: immunoglobulin domain-containing protein [Verrucomicrobiaceae bacterium]|nr:immunoglobulin domain-containing protein [Verrucomicrobiaceae bacterium]